MKQMAATQTMVPAERSSMIQEATQTIHPTSIIDPSAQIGDNVTIHANVVIEHGVKIGNGVTLHSNCYIGEDCVIGDHSTLFQAVILREKTQIGAHVVLEAGVVIGSDGFGYAKEANGINCKVPQVGYVVIEDGVKIGANSTIDRATLGKTVIGKGAVIGNLVQVGHNVDIGTNTHVGDSVGICGSCKIGSDVSIGQGVGMVGHISIGNSAHVKSGAGVSKDVAEHATIQGAPAVHEEQFNYFQNFLSHLPEFVNRLNTLEKTVEEMK
ncbi:MAG: UDP-3-O-(3-hydroxymyristoyl)glucosamine N-acyltransferase [bacterium]|jgi:UDP-3-O-[3-hydroxymyristoyl] glucosamine N-acyltransferase|nr:UDP-3-O-(3-hydroxymyristoyl)glucosamine N-acyltransferase [bacterium]